MIAVLAVVAALEGCGSSSRRDPPSLPYKTRVAMLVSQTRQLFSTAAYAVDELAAGGQPQAKQTLRQIQRRAERLVQDADNQLSSVSPVGSVIEQASTVVSSVAHTLQGPRAGSLSAAALRKVQKALSGFALQTGLLNSQSGGPMAVQVEAGLQSVLDPLSAG